MEPPTTGSESGSEREVFARQAQAVERLADYFVPAEERKRFARLVRAVSWIGARLFIVVGLLVGGSEAVQWLYQTWEIRNTAKDYAEVGSEIFYKENNPQVAKSLLQINAIILQPNNPFKWAAGWNSPIYCDNRKTLSYPEIRTFIRTSLASVINNHYQGAGVIAGVATAGIPHGALVAE